MMISVTIFEQIVILFMLAHNSRNSHRFTTIAELIDKLILAIVIKPQK